MVEGRLWDVTNKFVVRKLHRKAVDSLSHCHSARLRPGITMVIKEPLLTVRPQLSIIQLEGAKPARRRFAHIKVDKELAAKLFRQL